MKTSNKILLAVVICLFVGIVIVAVIVRGSVAHGVGVASLISGDNENNENNVVVATDNTQTKSFDLNGFNQVTLNTAIDHVVIKPGAKQNVQVTADRSLFSSIGVTLENKNLVINVTDWFDWGRNKRIDIVITTNVPLAKLAIHGAAHVSYEGLDANSFMLETHGTSHCELAGKVNTFSVDASGANRIDAANLKANDVTIMASGATHINVVAQNSLKVDASGASHIDYYGNPKNIQKNISGIAAVNNMGS